MKFGYEAMKEYLQIYNKLYTSIKISKDKNEKELSFMRKQLDKLEKKNR